MTNREYLEELDRIDFLKYIIFKLDHIKEQFENELEFEWWLQDKHKWEDEL